MTSRSDVMTSADDDLRSSLPALGVALALAGSGVLAISTSLAWGTNPLDPNFGIYASSVPVPPLIRSGATGLVPTLAFVLVTFAVLSAALAPLGERSVPIDLMRRLLGLLALMLTVLFAVRYAEIGEVAGDFSLPERLRLGFYLAIAGSLLVALGGRWGRRAEP